MTMNFARLLMALITAAGSGDPSPTAASTPALPPNVAPGLVIIGVIDTSGSMAHGRMETAIKEIKQLAQQMPPSAQHRWILVPFHESAYSTRSFQNGLPELEAFLGNLRASGGTRIAAGLSASIEELQRMGDVHHFILLLYTDGEDTDHAGLKKQEDRLASLFDHRTERGLGQTVVCRRWDRANAALAARFQKQRGVRTIDAGDARLSSVVLHPRLDLVDAQWSDKDKGSLDIRLRATATAQLPATDSLPTLRIRCLTPEAVGDTDIQVPLNQTAGKEFVCRIPIPLSPLPARVQLEFEVQPPAVHHRGNVVLFPSLAQHRLSVEAPVPRLVLKDIVQAELELDDTPKWHDPMHWMASVPLRIKLRVASRFGVTSSGDVGFRLDALGGIQWDGDQPHWRVNGPGEMDVSFVAIATMDHTGSTAQPTTLRFAAVAAEVPASILVDPPSLPLEILIEPPSPVVTKVAAAPIDLSPPTWVRLVDREASFQARVRVRVDGPLTADTRLILVAPPEVRRLEFTPDGIHRGDQVITLKVTAQLEPDRVHKLKFEMQTALPEAPLEIRCAGPVLLPVPGPRPAQAVLARGGKIRDRFVIAAQDHARPQRLPFTCVIRGATAQAADGLILQLRTRGNFEVASTPLSPGKPTTLTLSPRPDAESPFFRDRYLESIVECAPATSTAAVQSSPQQLVLKHEARFKSVLFWISCGLLSLLFCTVPCRFLWRLYQPAGDGAV